MKKFKTAVIAAALAAVMSVSLVSCGGRDKVTEGTSGMTTTVTTKADDKGNTTTKNEGTSTTSGRGTATMDTSVGGATSAR